MLQCGDKGGVHNQLGASKEKKPVSNHQSPNIACIRFREVEVSQKHVCGDSAAGISEQPRLPTDARMNKREPSEINTHSP